MVIVAAVLMLLALNYIVNLTKLESHPFCCTKPTCISLMGIND